MTGSIRRRVILWAMGALALGASLLVAGAWWVMSHEMGEVFEDNLKQVALAVANHHGTSGTLRQPRLAQALPRVYEEYGKFEFVTQVWARDGVRIHTSDESVSLPFLTRSGLSTVTANGEQWYLYTIVLEDGIVQAAQLATERAALARETTSIMIVPALVLLAVLAGLLAYSLQRALAPLSQAARDVTSRNLQSLDPIPLDSHPPELHLLVGAINDLMARLGAAMAQQRQFVADAAHELRTPIAALRLQLQLLERANGPAQRETAQAELAAGIARAQHLVEQLLQLSRLGPDAPPLRLDELSLDDLARAVVSQFSARAEQRGVDLGAVPCGADVRIRGDSQQLTILANNLVDNALRHTPPGGRVDVATAIDAGQPSLQVSDTGPGIAGEERDRVFDRFYRSADTSGTSGSGLGLAIVKAVAQRHQATVTLSDAPEGGLRVTVAFPAA
ncbi:HAMP domain-containing protein [Caenimonas koreensis DSM 17982]|uniref:histidine kinase n=1 Tax=Caenimonas koreensis DSM 17982 TaxID=1121255 RepID=A0A844APF6_9BURK|nr:ATP-binding protein [Caenimonas koreensis]MRD45990.1 HAMP domain-containing protein [Caenimonas koreensis DSM 17982]